MNSDPVQGPQIRLPHSASQASQAPRVGNSRSAAIGSARPCPSAHSTSTVRALAGMVEHCGLVIKHPADLLVLREDEFRERVKAAMDYYKHRRSNQRLGFEHGKKIQIEFMGLWDTVSALGVPQHHGSTTCSTCFDATSSMSTSRPRASRTSTTR